MMTMKIEGDLRTVSTAASEDQFPKHSSSGRGAGMHDLVIYLRVRHKGLGWIAFERVK